ncbi:MAG: hypothetical protein PVJ80_06430 [Gemmatimonadota bacterium]|jgi:hypothetical protein
MTLARLTASALAPLLITAPLAAQNAPPTPCRDGARFDEFDFWVGEWDVFVDTDRQAGTNRIEKVEEGCLLIEHWTGAAGGTGTSVNFYDRGRGVWRQLWVSSNDVVIEIEGGLRGDSMVLEGTLTSTQGRSQPFRGTWTPNPDGSVRQHFEISEDDGRTWSTWFDGRYVRQG